MQPDRPPVNPLDLVEALPEPQRTGVIRLKHFLESLQKIKPPSKYSDIFSGAVDAKGIARVQMIVKDGLRDLRTITIECPVYHWNYSQFANRLADEYGELFRALFLLTYAPDLYNGEVSPLEIRQSRTVKSMDLT